VTSKGGQTLEGLQVLRAIAALMVAVHHAAEVARQHAPNQAGVPDWLTTAGASGVDIFFVISGFIMMVVSFPPGRRPDGPWSFFRKRVARIYPFYWLTTAGMLFGWSVGLFDTLLPPALETDWIVRSFLLAPSEVLVVGVGWTLVHEMNFYLLFALSLCFGNRLVSLIGVSALLLLQLAVAPYVSDPATSLFLGRPIALEFAFGLALGYLYLSDALKIPAPLLLSLAAFAALLLAPYFIPHDSTGGLNAEDRAWAWGLPSVIVVAACAHWRVGKGRWPRAWLLMGDASYAIYLPTPRRSMCPISCCTRHKRR